MGPRRQSPQLDCEDRRRTANVVGQTMATLMRENTMRRTLAFAAAAAITAGSSAALAAEPGPDTLPINVIAIQTSDADDQAEALTKALRNAVRAIPGWSLGAGDYSLEVLTLSLKCTDPPDANCQSRIADQIKSDRYIWGTLKKKGTTVTGGVHLWVRGKGTSSWALDYTSNLTEANDEALKKVANDAIAQITGGPPKGGIHVRAGNVAGQVFVDGQPLGALKEGDGAFLVPSGPHKVTVKALGYNDMETQVVVKPTGAPTEVSLAMIPAADRSPINWKRVGGFGALGVGVITGVVGLVSAVKVNGVVGDKSYDAYRHANSGSNDVCSSPTPVPSNIANLCSTGKTFQTLEIAMFPVAAVAGGLGIFLIATSGRSAPKTTGLTFDPQVGPGIGKLDLKYTW
jgi:hypothetical protein